MWARSVRLRPSRLRELGRGDVEVVEQDGDRPGFFDRGEILADDVLDQGELERSGAFDARVDERGNRRLAGELSRAPAPLAGDQLVPAGGVWADDDRLQHASLADRIGERAERLLVEMLAGLVGVRMDLLDREISRRRPSGRPDAAGVPRGTRRRWRSDRRS